MAVVELKTAEAALNEVIYSSLDPRGLAASFVCPYPECGAYAQHFWGVVENLVTWPSGAPGIRNISTKNKLVLARCSVCDRETIFRDQKIIIPSFSNAPAPSVDMPEEIKGDFEEARKVLPLSPRGAAALLRLVVQKLLPLIGAKDADINKMIGELVSNGTISPIIQKALDSVRVIGNEAVHPGTMDLKDDQNAALSLFRLINFIVEKAITEPKEIASIFC